MHRDLPPFPNLNQQRNLAKTLLKAFASRDGDARQRFREHHPRLAGASDAELDTFDCKLADAQLVIAREYGLASWPELVRTIDAQTSLVDLSPAQKARALLEDPFLVTHPHHGEDADQVRALWRTMRAAMADDRPAVLRELDQRPELVTLEFFYAAPIIFAAKEGHTALVEILLDRGANPSCVGWWGEEPVLAMAEERGHHETARVIKRAIERGHAPDEASRLMELVEGRDHDALQKHLAEATDAGALRDRSGTSALHKAVELADATAVGLLIEAGAHVDEPDGRYHMRPIDWAIWQPNFSRVDHWDIVDQLAAAGATVTIEVAAARRDAARVHELVAADRDAVNFASPFGMTVKAAAAQNGDIELLRWLLDHGADASLGEGPWAYTLWIAVWNNNLEMAELLLEHGAKPNQYGLESSGTPAWVAAWDGKPSGRDPQMIELLIRYGGEDHSLGKTESLIVRHEENPDDARLAEEYVWVAWEDTLLDELLRREVPMPNVITLCQTYLFAGIELMERLLAAGLDPNLPNYLRMTPLHAMAAPRHNFTFANPLKDEEASAQKAELLVRYGADLNAIELYHDATPLGWAAKFGSAVMVECLLGLGADPALAGAPWATPLAFAERSGNDAIVRTLRAALAKA